jgi:hypothetical protein
MKIYIDCEWNSFGGELISMALVSESGEEFYEVLGCKNPADWIAKHVMPILNKAPVTEAEFKNLLKIYLNQFDSVNIVADCPEDIERFCATLITGPGMRLSTPPLSMQIIRIDAESALPHNALEDARGIALACRDIIF